MELLTQASELTDHASDLEYRLASDDFMGALLKLNVLAERFTDLAGDVAQCAFDAGATKKAIAGALGVPPSTFRGMQRRTRA